MPQQLPGMLGRIVRFVTVARFSDAWGWEIEIRHKHEGDPLNCPYVATYTDLSETELVQLLEDWTRQTSAGHTWESEGSGVGYCKPFFP